MSYIKTLIKLIENICESNYLNKNIIYKYFDILYNNLKSLIVSEKDMEKDFNELSSILWIQNLSNGLNRSLIKNTIEEKIINCFLFSNPLNIAFRENNKFKSNFKYRDVKIGSIFNNLNTTCYGIGNYIYYNNIKIKDDFLISIIHNIDPSYLGLVFHYII